MRNSPCKTGKCRSPLFIFRDQYTYSENSASSQRHKARKTCYPVRLLSIWSVSDEEDEDSVRSFNSIHFASESLQKLRLSLYLRRTLKNSFWLRRLPFHGEKNLLVFDSQFIVRCWSRSLRSHEGNECPHERIRAEKDSPTRFRDDILWTDFAFAEVISPALLNCPPRSENVSKTYCAFQFPEKEGQFPMPFRDQKW